MERRFCGVDLGGILVGVRPFDDVRRVAMHALEDVLTGALSYRVLIDDGAPPEKYCALILGRIEEEFHVAWLDGPERADAAIPDVGLPLIRQALAALPHGPVDGRLRRRLLASPSWTAGVLIIARTRGGTLNCGFAWNPALGCGEAARLFARAYAKVVLSWTGSN